MTADLSALIARLEAAEVGSRELDGAVWYAIHEPEVEHGCLHVEQTEQGPVEVLTCELGSKYADCVGNYTTSLDAALALADRVLPGWTVGCHTADGSQETYPIRKDMVIFDDGDCEFTLLYCHPKIEPREIGVGYSSSPALALCIAILKARQND